jgi:tetratricopeptide (TPR) repeat protein
MAPEQAAADANTDHRADIYALGALAYEMLTGRTPFIAQTPQALLAAHISQTPDPVSRHRPTVPPPLATLVMRCLEKHAADRWQSAGEIVAQLEAMATPSSGVTPVVSSGSVEAIRRAQPARVAAMFTAVSAGVLALVFVLVRILGLPDWVFVGAAVLLVLGLPIMLVTGHFERRRAQARATGQPAATPSGNLRGLFTWPRAIRGGVIAFAALGIGTAVWMLARGLGIGPVGTLLAKGRLAERDRLVVADFENRTTDATLGPSLTEAFRIDLAQMRIVTLVPSATVAEALGRMQRDPNTPLTASIARDVAAREGAKAVVAGEVSAVGRGFVLSTRLLAATDGTELVTLRETADDDRGLVAALDRLSKRLRERIGESLRSIRGGKSLERVTTASLPALKLYSEGVRAFNQSDYRKAALMFEQAIALDSNFAMAWRKLGVARQHMGTSRDQIVAALHHAVLLGDRLPEIERLQTEAFYRWNVGADDRTAAALYRQLLALDPDNDVALNNLSEILELAGQFAAAESLALRCLEVAPASVTYQDAVDYELALGHPDQARQTLARFARAFPGGYDYASQAAWFPATAGAFDSVQRALVAMGLKFREPGEQSDIHFNLMALSQIQGKLVEAERHRQQLVANNVQQSDFGSVLSTDARAVLGLVALRADTIGARRLLDSALARYPLSQITPWSRPYLWLVLGHAMAGQAAEARRLLTEYEAVRPEEVHNKWAPYLRGYVALSEGKSQDAIVAFRQVRDRTYCYGCGVWELGLAFDLAGQPDSAVAAYELVANVPVRQDVATFYLQWSLAPSLRRLGEIYEARGDRAKAAEYYSRFVTLWRDADPALQPVVRDVRSRLARLTSEGH